MRPMLAAAAPADGLDLPAYVSAKLDGIRAVIKDGRVWTRKLEPLPNAFVQRALGWPLLEGLDGELICGPAYADDVFNRTQSAVMSQTGEPAFMFYVFDYFNGAAQSTPYSQRLAQLQQAFALPMYVAHPYIELLEQHVVTDMDTLSAMQEDHIERGYEGLILRNPQAPYKFGRSTDNMNGAVNAKTGKPLQPWTMMKLKRFSSGEARVVDVVEMYRNENDLDENALGLAKRSTAAEGMVPAGVLGALSVVDCKSGVAFRIGSGFNAQERAELWQQRRTLIGSIARYKHFEVGVKTAPRFPIFQGFRDPRDMGEPA